MGVDGPTDLVWIITSKCNLNCLHCYASLYRGELELDFNSIVKIIDGAVEAGVEHINFTGGDPILRSDIFDILKYCVDVGVEPSLFTNLTLINDEMALKLSKLDVYVLTSIDGFSKETYEGIRGLSTWERFIDGVRRIISHGIEVHVNISVNALNYGYVDKILEKALDLGFQSFSMIPTIPSGRAFTNILYIDSERFVEAVKLAAVKVEELGISLSVWCAPFTGIIVDSSKIRFGCCRRWKVMDVTPSGRIVLCDVLNIGISNVNDFSVKEAWMRFLGNPMVKIVRNPKPGNPCDKCDFWGNCMGGCYARAYILTGSIENPDPLCPKVSGLLIERCKNNCE